jgi:hypothetical protein
MSRRSRAAAKADLIGLRVAHREHMSDDKRFAYVLKSPDITAA